MIAGKRGDHKWMVSVFAVRSHSELQTKRVLMPVIAGCVADGEVGLHDCIACGSDMQIDGVEKLKVYQSSEWAQRAFCSKCSHEFTPCKFMGK